MTNDRFADVFRRRYAELVRLAARVTGDAMEAEDVAQEALTRLSTHQVLDRPDDEIAAWLRRITINASFNRLRSRSRSTDRMQRSAAAERPLRDADRTGPQLAQVVRAEERALVRAALAQLPERQRTCLLLRHSGYRYTEIAAAVGIATGSVGVLLTRGEQAFRRHYEEMQ
ncbi:MAG: sigma-70 family RNA polymerase sigma factor [Actinobacteria bacterium]|nr:sigma-70 family RNA polymerase sigma factor [Actinomycetota bacterium]